MTVSWRTLEQVALFEHLIAQHVQPDPISPELEAWLSSLSDDALGRLELLWRWLELNHGDAAMTAFEAALAEAALVDGSGDPWTAQDPADPVMHELRGQLQQWLDDPDRAFLAGADVRGWLTWHKIDVDGLLAGELLRLVELTRVLDAHPDEGAVLPFELLWIVLGRDPGTDVRLQRSVA